MSAMKRSFNFPDDVKHNIIGHVINQQDCAQVTNQGSNCSKSFIWSTNLSNRYGANKKYIKNCASYCFDQMETWLTPMILNTPRYAVICDDKNEEHTLEITRTYLAYTDCKKEANDKFLDCCIQLESCDYSDWWLKWFYVDSQIPENGVRVVHEEDKLFYESCCATFNSLQQYAYHPQLNMKEIILNNCRSVRTNALTQALIEYKYHISPFTSFEQYVQENPNISFDQYVQEKLMKSLFQLIQSPITFLKYLFHRTEVTHIVNNKMLTALAKYNEANRKWYDRFFFSSILTSKKF